MPPSNWHLSSFYLCWCTNIESIYWTNKISIFISNYALSNIRPVNDSDSFAYKCAISITNYALSYQVTISITNKISIYITNNALSYQVTISITNKISISITNYTLPY